VVSVRCPACDRRLEGEDGDALSSTLATHLVREHAMTLQDPRMLMGGREGELSSEAEIEGGEEPVRNAPAIYGSGLTLRGGDLYGVDGPPRMDRVEDIDFVDCPLCGFRVGGKEENELTAGLREHLNSVGEMAAIQQAARSRS
jgi:hypothetical protein